MLKNILIILLIPLFLCSCSRIEPKIEISFASWGSVTEVGIIKEVISEFEKENPEIKVNFIHIPQNYFQKIHLMFASNTPPDVLFLNNLYLPIYADHLEDLRNIANADEFYPAAIQGLSYNGKLLGVPRDISNLVLYVNTDKTNLPDKNWKLEDLLGECPSLSSDTTFCISYEDTIYSMMPYLAYFGGGVLDKSLDLIIDSENSQKALNFYKDLKTKYHYAPEKSQVGSSTLAQMFLDGKIVFYLSGRWMYPKISETAKFNWAVINFPYGYSPQYADTSGWAVAKNSKNKDSAMKFVQFIAGEKTSKYFAETGLIVPARKDSAKLLNNNKHNEKVFLEVIEKSQSTPVSKDYNKLTDKLNKELNL